MLRYLIPTTVAGAITAIAIIFGAYLDALPTGLDRATARDGPAPAATTIGHVSGTLPRR